jgi:DNA helicase-2/ATP-dependent DNA helicase PcrA
MRTTTRSAIARAWSIFAELLLRTFELLTKHLNLLQHYQQRFKYILVDEFQDTNKLQYKWIKLLGGTNGCVFAVGDDDQCLVEGTAVTMAGGAYARSNRSASASA